MYNVDITCNACGHLNKETFKSSTDAAKYYAHLKMIITVAEGGCIMCDSIREPKVVMYFAKDEKILGDNFPQLGTGSTGEVLSDGKQDDKLKEINKINNKDDYNCIICGGTGKINVSVNGHTRMDLKAIMSEDCPICHGKGYLNET